ncbi:MAG: peptide chain release factor-like protein [Bdellovibrionota bacterium]
MKLLEIREEEITEKFIKGSGKGGQKINTTSSCVQLKHLPTGIEVKCQQDRSRAMNRFLARRELCDKIEEKILGEKSKAKQQAEKIRRQKRRRSRRAKAKMLDDKKKRGEVKNKRKKVFKE